MELPFVCQRMTRCPPSPHEAQQAKAHGAVKVSNLTGSMIHECSFNPQDSSVAPWQHVGFARRLFLGLEAMNELSALAAVKVVIQDSFFWVRRMLSSCVFFFLAAGVHYRRWRF